MVRGSRWPPLSLAVPAATRPQEPHPRSSKYAMTSVQRADRKTVAYIRLTCRSRRSQRETGRRATVLYFEQRRSPGSTLRRGMREVLNAARRERIYPIHDLRKYQRFAPCSTLARPNTSLSGPNISGPNATLGERIKRSRSSAGESPLSDGRGSNHAPKPQTNMEVNSATTVGFVSPNFAAMASLAGAIIDDEAGHMNVYALTTSVAAHFFLNGQLSWKGGGGGAGEGWLVHSVYNRNGNTNKTHFFGFSGSSGPSQSTMYTAELSDPSGVSFAGPAGSFPCWPRGSDDG